MEISTIGAKAVFPGSLLSADLAARELKNPFPVERTGESAFPAPSGPSAGGFGEKLEAALAEIDQKNREADSAAYKYASGENIPVHKVIIAAEQARLSIALAAEVRNKVLEAYQELSRTAG